MKTKVLTAFIALVGLTNVSHADHLSSFFRLDVNANGRCTAQLDHERAVFSGRSFTFGDLHPGHHHLVVKRFTGGGHHSGSHSSYILFDGDVFIPAAADVSAVLERNGMLRIIDVDQFAPVNHCGVQQDCHASAPVYAVIYPMSAMEFDEFFTAIKNRPFESTRVEIACRLLNDRYLTSEQAARLLSIFSFDSNRLEVAKVAYGRTVDRERFYRVFDSFIFDSSIRELSRFMELYS